MDLMRIGVERSPRAASPLTSHVVSDLYRYWPIRFTESNTQGVSHEKKACIFYRTLTLAVSRARKLKRSVSCRASAAG
jgi:hypothetical protein